MDVSATIHTSPPAYQTERQVNIIQQRSEQEEFTNNVAPPSYDATIHQPQGTIQPQIWYGNAHIEQPEGPVFIAVEPEAEESNIDIFAHFFLSFCSVFCCWPLGISAFMVSFLFCLSKQDGDYEDAKTYSRITLGLSIGAISFGLIAAVIALSMGAS